MGIRFDIPAYAEKALKMLSDSGYDSFIVGGAVRDMVMGLKPSDYDIATSALPSDIKNVFNGMRIIETGIKHGTVTVISDDIPLEITTFRIEGNYSDKRRPDKVTFTGKIKDDLSRRDFTCNALAYNHETGLLDYFNGLKDIENKVIRCVGDPGKRFSEDALRIMRALRLSSVLGFEIEDNTSAFIHSCKEYLGYVAKERIISEFALLLCGKDTGRVLRDFSDILFFIMPELKEMKGCSQNHPRHIYDVWNHTVCSVENIERIPELRLAMLFHDCGKPFVKTVDGNNIDHFYSHAKKSAEIANEIMSRFRVSNKIRNHVCELVELHDFIPEKLSEKSFKRLISRLGFETVEELFKIRRADILSQNPEYIGQSLRDNESGYIKFCNIKDKELCFKIKDLEINGSDLLEIGFSESPLIGKVLSTLLDEVMSNKLKNNKCSLVKRAKEFLNED